VWRTLHACNHETTTAGTNHSASHLVLHQVPQEQRWPSKRLQQWMVLKRLSGVELEGCVDTIGPCFRPRYGRPRLCHVTDAVLSPLNLEREGEGGEASSLVERSLWRAVIASVVDRRFERRSRRAVSSHVHRPFDLSQVVLPLAEGRGLLIEVLRQGLGGVQLFEVSSGPEGPAHAAPTPSSIRRLRPRLIWLLVSL